MYAQTLQVVVIIIITLGTINPQCANIKMKFHTHTYVIKIMVPNIYIM